MAGRRRYHDEVRDATFPGVAGALLAATLIAAPATVVTAAPPAYTDCGNPGEPACTGPVPTVDEVVGILATLTDPSIPAANKGDIVTPGFSPEEAGEIDDHLNNMNSRGYLPLNFVVTDIQPAPNNLAGATLAATGPIPIYLHTAPRADRADRSGRALADHPRHRHGRPGRVLAQRQPPDCGGTGGSLEGTA